MGMLDGWLTSIDDCGDVHVMPKGDCRPHEFSRRCWCQPEVDQEHDVLDGRLLSEVIIHRSADGREQHEKSVH